MASLLSGDPDFFLSFTMIIASNLAPSIESQIGDILWGGRLQSCLARSKIEADVAASSTAGGPDIPLVLVRSSGFIGRIEIQVREHCGMSVRRQGLYADIGSRRLPPGQHAHPSHRHAISSARGLCQRLGPRIDGLDGAFSCTLGRASCEGGIDLEGFGE